MQIATTRLHTRHARRYLGQLCKHFAHKIEVEHTETEGLCTLHSGPARLKAEEDGLLIEVEAANAEALAQSKQVIESHLLRFAFREEPSALVWTESTAK